VIALTGFRPDTSFLGELRVDLDPGLEAVAGLAEQIDPNVHSCGTVRASGVVQLTHPEPDFYIVGAKSYGRAPTFLALTGYEQVRSIAAELAGDHASARRSELVLPESGVCGGSGADADAASCCTTPAPVSTRFIELGTAPGTSSCCAPPRRLTVSAALQEGSTL
jgi:hypothetical protein